MQVVVSVKGRFHAFQLAQQLQKQGVLKKLITSYPAYFVKNFGIQAQYTQSLVWHELLARGWDKACRFFPKKIAPQGLFYRLFDQEVARHLKEGADIFVGWSGGSLQSIQRAKSLGMTTVVERGSTHIQFQKKILEEEYRKQGINSPRIVHPEVLERELAEYALAEYISVPSHYVKKTFVERGIHPEKILVTPYGVDLTHFKKVEKKDDIFRVIFCGGVNFRKGAHYLLQAFCELDLPKSEFWFIGNVSLEMRPWVTHYSSSKVHFKGTFPENNLYHYYSQGSLFCLPSLEEGFGMVIPQAMACGLPVLVTENVGAAELITHGKDGFVVRAQSVDALKEKILYCYQHQNECSDMGFEAEKRAQQVTWDVYGEQMLSHYHQLV